MALEVICTGFNGSCHPSYSFDPMRFQASSDKFSSIEQTWHQKRTRTSALQIRKNSSLPQPSLSSCFFEPRKRRTPKKEVCKISYQKEPPIGGGIFHEAPELHTAVAPKRQSIRIYQLRPGCIPRASFVRASRSSALCTCLSSYTNPSNNGTHRATKKRAFRISWEVMQVMIGFVGF